MVLGIHINMHFVVIFAYFNQVPGIVPLDPGRDSVQNDGQMLSAALIWVPFVPKNISSEIHVSKTQFYASRARHMHPGPGNIHYIGSLLHGRAVEKRSSAMGTPPI